MIIETIKINNIDKYLADIKFLLLENYKINFPHLTDFSNLIDNDIKKIRTYCDEKPTLIKIILLSNKVVAFIWAYEHSVLDELKIHISHIIVRKENQHSGLGSILIKNIEEYSRSIGIFKIDLFTTISNDSALKFYEKNGFIGKRILLEKLL